jgi:hypothetical protein
VWLDDPRPYVLGKVQKGAEIVAQIDPSGDGKLCGGFLFLRLGLVEYRRRINTFTVSEYFNLN